MIDFERLLPAYEKMLGLLVELKKFDTPPKDETDEFVVFLTRSLETWETRFSEASAEQREAQSLQTSESYPSSV